VKIEDNEPPEIIVTGDEKVGRGETAAAAFGKSSSCSYESSLVNGESISTPADGARISPRSRERERGGMRTGNMDRERRHVWAIK
jgi:hypothetical protein